MAKELSISTETVTPRMAADWLVKNAHNRGVSRKSVRSYARDTATGKWLLNGDAIRFNCNGSLIDGQHRLMAAVEAKAPFKSLVIRGLPVEVQETVDAGRKRGAKDALSLRGYENYALLAGSAKRLYEVRSAANSKETPTTAEIVDIVERHPRLANAAERARGSYPIYGSVMAAAYYITGTLIRGKKEEAEEFINSLMSGEPAYENDPAHGFREKLIRARASHHQVSLWVMLCSTLRIWNAFVAREEMTKIYLTDVMPDIEGFRPEKI